MYIYIEMFTVFASTSLNCWHTHKAKKIISTR